MQGLIASRIDYFCPLATIAIPQIEGKTVKAIAIFSKNRLPILLPISRSIPGTLSSCPRARPFRSCRSSTKPPQWPPLTYRAALIDLHGSRRDVKVVIRKLTGLFGLAQIGGECSKKRYLTLRAHCEGRSGVVALPVKSSITTPKPIFDVVGSGHLNLRPSSASRDRVPSRRTPLLTRRCPVLRAKLNSCARPEHYRFCS